MDTQNNKEVNEVEVGYVEPAEGGEVILPEDLETETPSESSTEEKPSDDTEVESEEQKPSEEAKESQVITEESDDEIKKLQNETPREYALRLEVTRLKRQNKQKRTDDLLSAGFTKKESSNSNLSPEVENVLSRYNDSEVQSFEELFDAVAAKKGYVRKDEFQATTHKEQAENILNEFLDTHPEYLPENDTDNLLWSRFIQEYSLYKEPENPKELKKLFSRVHREVCGIKSEDELKKITAQKEKIKVASHSGSSSTRGQLSSKATVLDPSAKQHLKGFTDEELQELGL